MEKGRMVMTGRNIKCNPYPLGAHAEKKGVRFAYASKAASCGIILYNKDTGRLLRREPFLVEEQIGNVYCKYLDDIEADKISYLFYEDDRKVPDPYAREFHFRTGYGRPKNDGDMKAVIPSGYFDWGEDANPRLKYSESIVYCMHVRGFTAHFSSRVAHRGTYLGVMEKIPYLKETGITTLELQPCYEFLELEENAAPVQDNFLQEKPADPKLNYWGYKKGYYYAPKANYAAGEDASAEFKELVKELHKNRMEVVMQFYFPRGIKTAEIPDILRFWVIEYHVDGFHLMGEKLPVELIASDPLLADTKLWYYGFDTGEIYGGNEEPRFKNLAVYHDEYLYSMRRMLKGDDNMLESMLYQLRRIPQKMGRIHYMSNYYGFTMADMVSYDYKHNEANGENNRDGSDYNCSWNCGEEGPSRKLKIKKLRKSQLKNAFAMLLFTQSTPLIFMGDEFGNSQKGNNNPYCQDNAVTWLDWRDLEKNGEIYDFWKNLTAFRKEHPILCGEKEASLMDYASCGYPDISYHGQNAWQPQTQGYNRHIGIMYCGKYARKPDGGEDDFLYFAVNMHWESHELALPRLPKGAHWETAFYTAQEAPLEEENLRKLPPRSIAVYVSVREREKTTRKKRNKNG